MGNWGKRFEKPPAGFVGFAAEGPQSLDGTRPKVPRFPDRRQHEHQRGPNWELIAVLACAGVMVSLAGLGVWKLIELLG